MNDTDRAPSQETNNDGSCETAPLPSARALYVDLFLASFAVLFFELALIRWLPAMVKIVSYFTNLVLMAAFLGLGVGCMLSRIRFNLLKLFSFFIIGVHGLAYLFADVFITFEDKDSIHVWIQQDTTSEAVEALGVVPAVTLFFIVVAITFVPLGQAVGRCFARLPSLRAYTVDILGSLTGSLTFALLSWLGAPPVVWYSIGFVAVCGVLRRHRGALALVAIPALLVLAVTGAPAQDTAWSPYYRVTHIAEPPLLHVMVNGSFHQTAFDMRPDVRAADRKVAHAFEKFSWPYRTFKPKKTLILGAGTGNDVYAAVNSGVGEVHAVEIDPSILNLGRQVNPARPYAAANVTAHLDDARSHLRRTKQTYDLVVFGTLDSQSLLSAMSTVRLDNYLYTVECFQDVRRVLAPGGTLVVLYSSFEPWIAAKIFRMLDQAFDGRVVARWDTHPFVYNMSYVAGAGVDALPAGFANYREVPKPLADVEVPTDDWPYLYLPGPFLPGDYWAMMAIILALTTLFVGGSWRLGRRRENKPPANPAGTRAAGSAPGAPTFFLLGAGFMLLETKSVTEMSLLYGSTWVVNVVVFASILAVIFCANWLILRFNLRNLRWPFWGLVLALLFNYFFPIRLLLGAHESLQVAATTVLVGLPVGFAAFIFAVMFREAASAERMFGANLVGAMVGGVLEYFAMVVGLKALYLLALTCYLLMFLTMRRAAARPLADPNPNPDSADGA